MSAPFDPYLQWLGIRDPQRPPNYYRLLGIELFESDFGTISQAAERQMAQVRTFQYGPHGADAQRILNEIAAAKACLLHPLKKGSYDAWLRGEVHNQAPPQPSQHAYASPQPVPPVAPPALAHPSTAFGEAGGSQPVPRYYDEPSAPPTPPQRNSRMLMTISILATVALMLFAVVVFLANSGSDRKVAAVDEDAAKTKTDEAKTESKPDGAKTEGGAKPAPQENVPPPPRPRKTTAETPKEPVEPEPPAIKPKPKPKSKPAKTAEPEEMEPEPQEPEEPAEPAKEPATPGAKSGERRLSIPSAAAQADAKKEILKVLADDYAEASKPPEKPTKPSEKTPVRPSGKAVLAAKLLKQGLETKDDPVYCYVLLAEARDMALAAGDAKLLKSAVDSLARSYQIEPLEELTRVLTESIDQPMPAAVRKSLAHLALDQAQQALQQDLYDAALRLAKTGEALARKARELVTARQAETLAASVPWRKQQYDLAQQAEKALLRDPENAKANLMLGTYHTLLKEDWAKGLPLLAKGNDPTLKELAAAELAADRDSAVTDMVKLGDRWKAAADSVDSNLRGAARRRAIFWYERALPQLSGFSKTRVERLLEDLKGE